MFVSGAHRDPRRGISAAKQAIVLLILIIVARYAHFLP
jgi:hypothetical protein